MIEDVKLDRVDIEVHPPQYGFKNGWWCHRVILTPLDSPITSLVITQRFKGQPDDWMEDWEAYVEEMAEMAKLKPQVTVKIFWNQIKIEKTA